MEKAHIALAFTTSALLVSFSSSCGGPNESSEPQLPQLMPDSLSTSPCRRLTKDSDEVITSSTRVCTGSYANVRLIVSGENIRVSCEGAAPCFLAGPRSGIIFRNFNNSVFENIYAIDTAGQQDSGPFPLLRKGVQIINSSNNHISTGAQCNRAVSNCIGLVLDNVGPSSNNNIIEFTGVSLYTGIYILAGSSNRISYDVSRVRARDSHGRPICLIDQTKENKFIAKQCSF